jgi:hypothetical protein
MERSGISVRVHVSADELRLIQHWSYTKAIFLLAFYIASIRHLMFFPGIFLPRVQKKHPQVLFVLEFR